MDRLLQDVRLGLRALRRSPGFTLLAVPILALGIGMATAMLTAFDAVILQNLPVSNPDEIVVLSAQRNSGTSHPIVPGEVETLRRESRTLQDLAGVSSMGVGAQPLMDGDRPLVLDFAFVTADFFAVLGARPVLGRLFRTEDGQEGAAPAAVISHRAWQSAFGGDPGVVGHRLTNTQLRVTYSVVGVAPPGLDFPVGADYWVLPGTRRQGMNVIGRLAPGVSPDVAQTEFLSLVQALDTDRSNPRSPTAAIVRSLSDAVRGNARPILLALTGAVVLLLLITCVNVGTLSLMRATSRSRDVMVRRAMGATSSGIARLFLVEGALMGVAAGGLGLLSALALLELFPALAPTQIPRTEMIVLSGSPVAMAVGVTFLAIFLFGVAPAFAAGRGNLAAALRIDARSGTGTHKRRRVRQTLVTAQVALTVVLLFGAGLLVRSLHRLGQLELGYEANEVSIVEFSIDRSGDDPPSPRELAAVLDGVFDGLGGLPGVTAVTPVMTRPFRGGTGVLEIQPQLEGQSESEVEANPRVPLEVGGSETFETFGIPIVRGRGFLESDREDATKVAVVSETVAQRLWPGRDPIGQRILMSLPDDDWWTVVGVAGDTRFRRLQEATPTIYLPWRQLQVIPGVWTVAVRTEGDLASLVPAMRRTIAEIDSRIDVWRAGTLNDLLDQGPLAEPRLTAILLSGFGLVALLLSATGLFGVTALGVRERTHELGVRRALGAPASLLRRNVLRDALLTVAIGTAVGLGTAVLASRVVESLLFDVSRTDPVTLAGVCLVLLAVSAVAALVPARRATRIDPMRALRVE